MPSFLNFAVRKLQLFLLVLIGAIGAVSAGETPVDQLEDQSRIGAVGTALGKKDENSHDLFNYESTYTLNSDFKNDDQLGDGDSLYTDVSYDHRFLITGKWYFRAGLEYERFDFDGTDNGLPDHLQAAYGHLAFEYVVKDHAGASIEIDPGIYFQERITSDAFDIPWKIFVSFPLKKDTLFGVIGLGGGIYQDPIVAPGGGIVWLISEKMRLEGVFPKPALVYNPSDDWQFRLLGELLYRDFRTDDVTTTATRIQEHNAILQYNEDRAGFEARYSGLDPFRITAGAGCTFMRQFDFYRSDVRAKLEPAPYFRISVEAKF